LRLGFHYHVPATRDRDGRLRTPGYQGRFLDALATRCERLVCFLHSPRPDEIPHLDHVLEASNIDWVNLGPHASVPRRLLSAGHSARAIRKRHGGLDALLLRGPSPLLPALAAAAKPLPVALLLVGDYLASIEHLPQPRWRKELIRCWALWNRRGQRRAAREALTLVNSRRLYQDLKPYSPHLVETRTTTLCEADFFPRPDTCRQRPVRLLYSGRLHREKGLFPLVEAVAALVRAGHDVVLDLVGWAGPGDNVIDELRRSAEAQAVSSRVVFHGFQPIGPALSTLYKSADVYVSAAFEESFPRSIWEAMAHGLPVVATAVGSIPDYLRDRETAIFVDPGSPGSLADGIAETLCEQHLRQKLVRQGFALAQQNTLAKRTAELITALESWIRQPAPIPSFVSAANVICERNL